LSTAERKARKRAGLKFERKPKTGTPLIERAWFESLIFDAKNGWRQPSTKKRIRALKDRGYDVDSVLNTE
jgi:hypothetical protein